MNSTPSRQSASPTVKASIAPAALAALGRHLLRLLAAYSHDLKCQTPGPPRHFGRPRSPQNPFPRPLPRHQKLHPVRNRIQQRHRPLLRPMHCPGVDHVHPPCPALSPRVRVPMT